MIAPLPALRAAVAELLAAQGDRDLADIVAAAELDLAGAPERWSMGAREVAATRLALVVDPAAFAALSGDPARLGALKDAFARAVRTPETELAELALVLRLAGFRGGWLGAYREAAPRAEPDRPDPEAVLGGAAALVEAYGDAAGAAILRRARLEAAAVPGAGPLPLLRYLLRLDPADRAALERDWERAERLRRAVHDAGTRASEAVASVDLAAALAPLAPPDGPEARLVSALAARGASAVPVARRDGGSELAVVVSGELRRVAITDGAARDLVWRLETIPAIAVDRARLDSAEGAYGVAALLCEGAPVD